MKSDSSLPESWEPLGCQTHPYIVFLGNFMGWDKVMHAATTSRGAGTVSLQVREARGRQQAGSPCLDKEARGTVICRVRFLPDQKGKHGEYLGSCSGEMGSKTSSRCQGGACRGMFIALYCLVQTINSVPQRGLNTISCGLDFQGVRKTLWTKMHEKECEKLYNCHTTRLRVLPCDTEYPWQESIILSMGFSHPSTESVYPIRFPKHGKSYVRRKQAS